MRVKTAGVLMFAVPVASGAVAATEDPKPAATGGARIAVEPSSLTSARDPEQTLRRSSRSAIQVTPTRPRQRDHIAAAVAEGCKMVKPG